MKFADWHTYEILRICDSGMNLRMFEFAIAYSENKFACPMPTSDVGQPHNPMVNSGAIMSAALLLYLVQPRLSISEKFEFITNFFTVWTSFSMQNSFLIG
jgi:hypothetical protein